MPHSTGRRVRTEGLAVGLAAWVFCGAAGAQQAEVVCPPTTEDVSIDGKLDEPVWRRAASFGPLVLIQIGATPDHDATKAKLLYDSERLYLGVTCRAGPSPGGERGARDDGRVWRNDHLEIFVSPDPDSQDYYHLVLDRAGTMFDARRASDDSETPGQAWNGDWKAAVAETTGGWTAECAIPFAALGLRAPEPGDLWRFKLGRDGGKDGPIMWPMNRTGSFHSRRADGALYFEKQNLLINGDFESGKVVNGAPEPWRVTLTTSEVDNKPQGEVRTVEGGIAPGKRALLFKKLATALWWPQVWNHGYNLEPGGTYEFSIMVQGTMPQVNLRSTAVVEGHPVKMSQGRKPAQQFTRLRFAFVVPNGAETVSVGLSAPAGAAGQVLYDNAVLRRLLHAEEAMERQFVSPDWSPDPDPVHGLESLCERAGHKPWDLYWRDDHLLTYRVIFQDRKYGTQLWMLDNSPVSEYVVTASIWPGWNADCSVLMLPGRRLAGGESKRRWLCNADFSRLTPMPTGGMPLWDLENPDVYYIHSQGEVKKVNFRRGEEQVLATWKPRGKERSYGLTKDNRAVFVVDWDGGEWVPYTPVQEPLPYVKVLDCYGPDPDRDGRLPSLLLATETESGPKFRIMTGTRVYTDTGHTERVIVPISGRTEYLKTFVSGRVKFPRHAALPDTRDLDELFRIYHNHPSCSHGHLSYSPDSEYICWDGSPSFYRTRDGGDAHEVAISPNGWCYHTCWFYDPRFFVTCVRPYRTNYDRPVNAGLLCQVFTDGTWQAICDIKMRPNAFYYGGNFATLSRDATKVHYESSMTGVHKNYVAVMARPQPPRDVRWRAEGNAVVLSWSEPPHHKEIKGTLVYRSERSGDGYQLLTREPVEGETYRDETVAPGRPYYYVLTSLEHCGLESGYSAEAARAGLSLPAKVDAPLVIYAEAEDALVDLASGDKPGLSVGRDAVGASNWYYVYLTPKATSGSATLRFEAPADSSYFVWLRVRRSGETAKWSLALDGKPGLTADGAQDGWKWVKCADAPVPLRAGRHELTLTTADGGARADLICLATDAAFTPRGVRPEDREAPGAVTGLKVEAVGDRAIRLSWDVAPEPDFFHYNVYGAREPIKQADQKYLLASPTYGTFVDWGLRAGTTYHYAVTAVDRRGNEGPPAAVPPTKTPDAAHPPYKLELAFDRATLDGPFERAEGAGTRAKEYVILPDKEKSEQAKVTWEVEIPHEGRYYFWLRYLPRGAASSRGAAVQQNISVLLDGQKVASVGGGLTDLSVPDSVIRPEFWTWARPVVTDLEALTLPAGKHDLTLEKLTPGVRYDVLFVTAEPSFLPGDGRLRQR